MLKISAIVLSALCFVNFAYAENQSIEQMQQVAKEFITNNLHADASDKVTVEVSPVNVELPKCAQALTANFPPNTLPEQVNSIEVSCNDNPSWRMLLPVTVQIFTNVVVARQVIPAGEPINQDNVTVEQYDKNRLYSGYYKTIAEVVGNNAAHTIASGSIITQKAIQLPTVIHRGQKVNVSVKKQSIVLNMEGVAKTDGALNSVIEVYNPSSKRIIDAVVVGPTEAQVTL